MQYATILRQPVCKFLIVSVSRSKEYNAQIRFMRWIASGIFADVRLHGRDGLRLRPAVAWQWRDFGGQIRGVRRTILLRNKEKNGTAWTCPAEALAKAEAVPP
jgi:hypothetical protein